MADIGLIGLGVMGRNLALNMADHGYTVAVYNRTGETTRRFVASAGALGDRLVDCADLPALVERVRPPRLVLMIIKAGAAVDQQIAAVAPLLTPGDVLIDGGNANFRDTIRRCDVPALAGIHYLGVGISGGEEGARNGPSIMAGGSAEGYDRVASIFNSIAAVAAGDPCAAHLGRDGAGHFVKTMHNGIEYADMQMIAEVYAVMRHALGIAPAEMADIFRHWNAGALESYLIEITADILATRDPEGGGPLIDLILDKAGQKGTGRWAATEALDLGVPAPTIYEAVAARALSSLKEERIAAEAAHGATARVAEPAGADEMIGSLEDALLAGKVVVYAQGFAVMAAASHGRGWSLPFATIARIWRAGCIIRAGLLNDIAAAFEDRPDLPNLLVHPSFVAAMKQAEGGLRTAVAAASGAGLPTPALASALAYFDGYRRGRGSADLIQAQRDYFGAHTFQRVDRPGAAHFDWSKGRAR